MENLLQDFELSLSSFLKGYFYKFTLKQVTHDKLKKNCDYSIYGAWLTDNENNESQEKAMTSKLLSESKLWSLQATDVECSGNHLSINLEKKTTFLHGINLVLTLGDNFGKYSKFIGKKFVVTTDVISNTPETLSELRIKLAKDILERVLIAGGAVVTDALHHEIVDKHIHLGNKYSKEIVNKINSKSCTHTLVSVVSKTADVTPCGYKSKIKENLMVKIDGANCPLNNDDWSTITNATVLYDLLRTKLSKCVKLSQNIDKNKGAVFIIYNYARLTAIMKTYEDKIASGDYPKLPKVTDIDFSFLSDQVEWQILFDYILGWPSLLINVTDFDNNDSSYNYRIHTLVTFIENLAICVSSYYSRVQILTNPRPQMLPFMYARLYLLKALIQVMANCFSILGIKPLTRM